MDEGKFDPMVPGGPAPTETVQDWHALLAVARELKHPLVPLFEKLEYEDSCVGLTESSRVLTIWLRFPPEADAQRRDLMSLAFTCGRKTFGGIILGWSDG